MFDKPLFNPMLQGFTNYGMSIVNGTQGLTHYGMESIHRSPSAFSSLDQQHNLYDRRQRERNIYESYRYEPPKYEIPKYEPIKPFVPSYDLPVFDRSCPECGKSWGHYFWCGRK